MEKIIAHVCKNEIIKRGVTTSCSICKGDGKNIKATNEEISKYNSKFINSLSWTNFK